jgi:DNA ligase (NAD+)
VKKTTSEANEIARNNMAQWRKANPLEAREQWRRAYWRGKGYPGYAGVALGLMNVPKEIRKKVLKLREQIHQWNHDYYVWSLDTVSDAEYDRAFEELRGLEAKHPEMADPNSPTMRVGAPLTSSLAKVEHTTPMLSLDKVTTPQAVCKFFGKVGGVVEPKVDGASLAVRYVNGRLLQAVTRGDGKQGEDVTHNARTIQSLPLVLPKSLTIEVRGEVFVKLSDFAKMNAAKVAAGEEPASNPRNTASGALQLLKSESCAAVPLSFMACRVVERIPGYDTHDALLELLEELGFITTSALPLPVKDCMTMFQSVGHLDASRRCQDFPTDGLVFKINDLKVQAELGEGTTAPRWALAFKYPPEQATTRVESIEFTVGKTGKITPVANLTPVLLSGSVVSRASLCNRNELQRLKVDTGDQVVIEKSNEIIPKVLKVAKKGSQKVAKMPDKCPACGEPVTEFKDYVDLFCMNPLCAGQLEARLVHATGKSALDIDGCGPALIGQLLEHGITSLAALLAAKDFPFLKPAARKKLREGTAAAARAPFWRKLMALCIDSWGEKTCQEVAARFLEIQELLDNDMVDEAKAIAALDGMRQNVGKNAAAAWDQFFSSHLEELDQLAATGFWKPCANTQIENPNIKGKAFCITGSLNGCERHVAHEAIRQRGGIVKSSVTRHTDYLVVGENSGGNKSAAAQRWSTRCLTPDAFFELMEWFPAFEKPDPDKEY